MRLDMSDDLVKRLTIRLQEIYDRPHDFSNGQKSEAAGLARDRIEELEAKLAKAVEIGDKMAASIERNYYLPGVATDWRKLTGGKGE